MIQCNYIGLSYGEPTNLYTNQTIAVYGSTNGNYFFENWELQTFCLKVERLIRHLVPVFVFKFCFSKIIEKQMVVQ